MSPPTPPRRPADRRRLLRLAVAAAALALGVAALGVVPIWLATLYEQLVPRAWRRALTVGTLQAIRAAFLLGLVAAPATALACGVALGRARRAGRRAPRAARGLLLGVSSTLALAGIELGLGGYLAWKRHVLDLPTRFPQAPARRIASIPTDLDPRAPEAAILLVVVGESSAEGQPYEPRLSVGQLVAPGLRQVFPGREVEVRSYASGGITLEQAALRLHDLDERPDALIVYAGHNEFQGRFGWAREVPHYDDEPRALAARESLGRALGRYLAVCRLVADAIDRQQIDRPPPMEPVRRPVDRPACSPEERERVRREFARTLDDVAAYARRVGALPVLIAPAGNEADYPPARSVLRPSVAEADREAFARELLAARALESADPSAAEAAYRGLAAAHPEHAEARYRLGRLLAARGLADEARPHLRAARDLDGMPMRCPGELLDAFPAVAARHDALLVDGPAVLAGLVPDGLLDFRLVHDAQHPTLRSYVALAQAVLDGMAARRAFGWPEGVPAPRIDPAEAAEALGIDDAFLAVVAGRTALFYQRIAGIRYDRSEHEARAEACLRDSRALRSGTPSGRPGAAPAGPPPP